MKIGKKLKQLRNLKELSQAKVAEKLCISPRAYSDIENDKTKLDLDCLEKLSEIFETSITEILTIDSKY